jgi:hypothetical protein
MAVATAMALEAAQAETLETAVRKESPAITSGRTRPGAAISATGATKLRKCRLSVEYAYSRSCILCAQMTS